MVEAENKAEENYETKKKRKRAEKNNFDANIRVIFPCDEQSDWDEELFCHNKCRIHLRCEGRILEDLCLPENYECEECKTGAANKEWLEDKINERKHNLIEEVEKLRKEHNTILMKIERI